MIEKVEMYQAVCDGCGCRFEDADGNHCVCYDEPQIVWNIRMSDWIEIDNKLYCPECVEFDEKTKSYKLKER